jgi:hypothetical protein
MSVFAVLRIAKINTLSGLSGASAHNSRMAQSGTKHADNRSPLMGGGAKLVAGQEDALEAWHARAEAVGLKKPRKDAVRALEAVMSASPAWFAEASPDDRQAWLDKSLSWAVELFGQDNILSAHLHDDEETPHLHILAVPLTHKVRTRAGRPRKGREGEKRKAVASWGLSAADFVGSPEKLVDLQTQYASQVSGLGIRRGRARRATGANHISATLYRAQAADELTTAQSLRNDAMDQIVMAEDISVEASSKASKIVREAKETAEAFTLGLDAVDQNELIYRPEGLVRRKVEEPVLPVCPNKIKRWKTAIRPIFDALLAYAQRSSVLGARSADLDERTSELTTRECQLADDAATVSRMLKRAGQPAIEVEKIGEKNRQRTR